jgi:hypothetical protein
VCQSQNQQGENMSENRPFLYGRVMLILLGLTYLGMNVWSILVVGHGLIVSENFKAMPEWSIYLFAAGLQTSSVLALLYIPGIWRSARWPAKLFWVPALCAIVGGIIAFECVHQVLSQVKESQGQELVNVHNRELDGLRTRINTLFDQSSSVYNKKSAEYLEHAQRARRGLDDSGVAVAGPIYRSRLKAYEQSRTQFVDLELTPSKVTTSTELRALLADIQAGAGRLEAQQARLNEFFKALDNTGVPANFSAEVASIRGAVEKATEKYKSFNSVNPRSLAINETLSLPGKIYRGESFPTMYWLAIAYGIAPFACAILLSANIRHLAERSDQDENPDEIERQIVTEKRLNQLNDELADVRVKGFGARARRDIFSYGNVRTSTQEASNDSKDKSAA